ncbi:hypothetical protein V8F33_010091 [Rhypophila sp. PSN 637]
MRRVRSWSCWACVGLTFLGFLGETTASYAARPKRQHDSLHWVAKAQVTAQPLLKRDDQGSCPELGQKLCPASLGGNCCPSQYECHTDSCYATTAGPTTACGKEGFFACGADDSGGCCPIGYLCGPTACTPPADASRETHTSCPFDYYLCAADLNYGCCMSGMGCGLNECYTTTPVTQTITEVFTTTAGDETITSTRLATTISTPVPPTASPTPGFIPKFVPDVVAKIPQVPTKSTQDGEGGLTKAQLGGIVGGVVALLIIVIAATVLIIRRLKRVTDAVESQKEQSNSGRTKSQSQAQMAYYGAHLHLSGDDSRSIDPLMVTPNTGVSGSGTGTPQIGGGTRERSDSDAFSPLQNGRTDSVDASGRHVSVDSPSYFDIPTRPQNIPGGRQQMSPAAIRESADSHATGQYSRYAYHHWRQHSNASELSGDGSEVLGSPIPELDSSGAYAELAGREAGGPRSRSSSIASPRVSFSHARKRSESNGQGPEGSSAAGASTGFGPLDVVTETAEHMHGYYGPRDKQAGQTAAGLNVDWDISSPVAAAQPLPQPMMVPTPPTPYTPVQQPQQQQQQYQQQPQVQQNSQAQQEPYQLYQQFQQYQQYQQHTTQPTQDTQFPQQPQQPHHPPPSQ